MAGEDSDMVKKTPEILLMPTEDSAEMTFVDSLEFDLTLSIPFLGWTKVLREDVKAARCELSRTVARRTLYAMWEGLSLACLR